MPFNIAKRTVCDNTKSPLKVVSPIIRKYAEQRQKRTRNSRKIDRTDPASKTTRNLKAILPKATDGEVIPVEPELIRSVNPSAQSTITTNHLPDEIAQPVQEICAIARLVAEDAKNTIQKSPPAKISRKRSGSSSASSKKKLLKQGKLVESAFELLRPESLNVVSAREKAYVENYFQRVKTTFSGKNENIFIQFCAKLEELDKKDSSVVKFFQELTELFTGHFDLIEDFMPFLSSEQALECGVFMEHLTATKMMDFLSLIEAHFAKSPYQIKKIHAALEKVFTLPTINLQEISTTILPLLKGNAVLTDFFLELLPSAPPPDPLPTDFEDLDEEAMSDGSDEGKTHIWERVELPNAPDPYGGTSCICTCHHVDNKKFRTRLQHCIPCSKKFINGKIFIQSGKFLRRAKVTFNDNDMEFHRRRLHPNPNEPRKRKKSGGQSPSKLSNQSLDEHRSDGNDEDKGKSKCGKGQKTPRSKVGKVGGKSSGKGIEGDGKEDGMKEKPSSRKSLKMTDDSKCKGGGCDKNLKVSDSLDVEILSPSSDNLKPLLECQDTRKSPITCKQETKISINDKRNRWQEMDIDETPSGSDTVTFVTASEALALSGLDGKVKIEEAEMFAIDACKSEDVKAKKSPCDKRQRWHEMETDGVPSGADTVTFVTVSEALSLPTLDCEIKLELNQNLEGKVMSPVGKVVDSETPSSADTVTFVTVSEALALPTLDNEIKQELNNVLEVGSPAEKVESEVTLQTDSPIIVVIQEQSDASNRQSPPVISIPESNAVPPLVDPLLTAVESTITSKAEASFEASSVLLSPNETCEDTPWRLEEDRVILHTLQTETYCEETFAKINEALPLRTIEGIKKRFQELLNILYKMKASE